MPIQVYSILTRGHNIGGNARLKNKEEAEGIYNKLLDAITNDKPFVELELDAQKFCVRTKDITSFGINVHMEEIPEEIKARQIAEIERGFGYSNQLGIGYQGEKATSALCGGGGLI